MPHIVPRLFDLNARISAACLKSGRPVDCCRLLAVSKTRTPEEIRAVAALGVRDFGENYVQEALPKMAALADLPLTWHLIGPLQSNKTREAAEHFGWVHSIDREKIARRLNDQRPAARAAEGQASEHNAFARLATTLQALAGTIPGLDAGPFDTLSMGMSDDFPEAIAAGATWVRIGTALFGSRPAAGKP